MVYLKIEELLKKNKKSKYWLVKSLGINWQTATNLMKHKTKGIKFDTLENLCDLFQCEIGELVVVKKDSRKYVKKGK